MYVRVLLSSLLLTGCVSVASGDPSDQKDAVQQETAADTKRGKVVYLLCRSCHTLEKDEPHLTGPNLHGFFNTTAASREGYIYSDALKESNIYWDNETLDAWIENPAAFLPGNRMAFTGVSKASDRAALIAYIVAETSK